MENLNPFFKSIIDQDHAAVVICNAEHTVVYMNPAAVTSYAKRGGEKIVGRSIFACHNEESCRRIREITDRFATSAEQDKVHTFFNPKQNKDVYMVALRDENGKYIGYYEKHEFRSRDDTPFYLT